MSNSQIELLQQVSLALSYMAQNDTNLSDEQALAISAIYPAWHTGVDYRTGQVVNFNAQLYRCVQDHLSQDGWAPNVAVSLWSPIRYNDEGVEQWTQPTGAHNAYNVGDVVEHNSKRWKSLVNGNVWEPSDAVPTLWAVVD